MFMLVDKGLIQIPDRVGSGTDAEHLFAQKQCQRSFLRKVWPASLSSATVNSGQKKTASSILSENQRPSKSAPHLGTKTNNGKTK